MSELSNILGEEEALRKLMSYEEFVERRGLCGLPYEETVDAYRQYRRVMLGENEE